MFRKAQAAIKGIKSETLKAATVDEKQLRSNIRAELAREVQDLSLTFRSAQKTYLQGYFQHIITSSFSIHFTKRHYTSSHLYVYCSLKPAHKESRQYF
jgi:hypothetical protein